MVSGSNVPVVGDWVICGERLLSEEVIEVITNMPGKVIEVCNGGVILVQYYGLTEEFKKEHFGNNDRRYYDLHNIVFHSKTKEECEIHLATKKYNL